MKRRERHPRITPLRALDLALELQYKRGETRNQLPSAVDAAYAALVSHVRAALVRGRK